MKDNIAQVKQSPMYKRNCNDEKKHDVLHFYFILFCLILNISIFDARLMQTKRAISHIHTYFQKNIHIRI